MVLDKLSSLMHPRHRNTESFDVTLTQPPKRKYERLMQRYDLHIDCPVDSPSSRVRLTAVRRLPSRNQVDYEPTGTSPRVIVCKPKDDGYITPDDEEDEVDIQPNLPPLERLGSGIDEQLPQISAEESPFEDSVGEHFEIEHVKTAFRAASKGDVSTVQTCIYKLGIPVDTESLKGVSMLQLAITGDHIKTVKLLVEIGANLHKATARGRTPLLTASRYGALRSLKLLIQVLSQEEKTRLKKLNVKSECDSSAYSFLLVLDENGDSALHLACRGLDHRCVKALLRVLISSLGWQTAERLLSQANQRGYAPIHVACMWRSVAVVKLLLTADCNSAISKVCPLGRTRRIANALRKASVDALTAKLQTGSILHEMACSKPCSRCGCDPDPPTHLEGETALSSIQGLPLGLVAEYEEDDLDLPDHKCMDCEKRAREVVMLVAKACPMVLDLRSQFGMTPLMSAVARDALGVAEALLQLKVDLEAVDEQGRTAMHHAASRGVSRQVAILLSWGASACRPDFECNRPMQYAAVRGHTASLRFLYKANKHIDVASPNGHTAFMWATMYGCDTSLRTMLNANPVLGRKDRDNEGNTALHLAAKRDLSNTAKFLVSAGWDLELKNDRGETPFLLAAANGCSNAMRALLTYGADVFAIDKDGNSAVHLSSQADGCRDALRELLGWLTEPKFVNLPNREGKTPLHLAANGCAVKCVRELLKNGADIRKRDQRGWDSLMVATNANNPRSWPILTLMIKHSPNINGYSAVDNVSTLSLAQASHNELFVAYLKMHGALYPFEILDQAARKIQRWYRKNAFMRGLLRQPDRKGRRVRKACASLGADMLEAGANISSLCFGSRLNLA